jgi:HEAT repeat protein
VSEFSRLYDEVASACSSENIPQELNQRLGAACTHSDIATLIGKLESLNKADLVGDAGDRIDFYWRLRTSISDALAAAGEKAEGPLLATLNSTNEDAAQYAARALGLMKSKQAIEPILGKLRSAPNNATKMMYIEAIGDIGDGSAVKVLLPYLKRSHEQNGGWLVRVTANALGKIGNKSVLNALCGVLRHDSEMLARLGAAEGLGALGCIESLPCLRRALKDKDRHVAKAAEESIGLIRLRNGALVGRSRISTFLHSLFKKNT